LSTGDRNRSAVPPTFAAVLFPRSARTCIHQRTSVLPRSPDYSEDKKDVPTVPSWRPTPATKYCVHDASGRKWIDRFLLDRSTRDGVDPHCSNTGNITGCLDHGREYRDGVGAEF